MENQNERKIFAKVAQVVVIVLMTMNKVIVYMKIEIKLINRQNLRLTPDSQYVC